MENQMKSKILTSFFIALISLSACKSVDITGINIKEADIQFLNTNHPTQEQVFERLGTPTIVPDYSPNIWYYVYIKTTKSTLSLPSIVEQKILKLTFNNANKLEHAAVMDNGFNNNVSSVSHVTPTPGTDASPLQEFVKNIGRFNKTKKKK
jgi:outer membrane protein assembly factor BamE (lipoprotein component of BamABCDE complex)